MSFLQGFPFCVQLRKKRSDAASHHLASLVEGRFDDTRQQLLVAVRLLHVVSDETHHGTAHLGRRVEHPRLHGEEIFDVIVELHQYGQDAVGFAARRCRQSLRHFFLNHACAARNQVAVFQHFEKNLTTDVVGVVSRQQEGFPVERVFQVHFQKVVFNEIRFQLRELLSQVGDALKVQFDDLERTLFFQEKLSHDSHARSDLKNRQFGVTVHRVGNRFCRSKVRQKVLTQKFFRTY